MKFTKVFTSFLIILLNFTMFNTAYANSIAGSGWNITSSIVNGATTTFNATKTKVINGASVAVTGVAKITPTGSQVGKMILRTGLTLAVTTALDTLLNATDYVLDPANNSITYLPKPTSSGACGDSSLGASCSDLKTVWWLGYGGVTHYFADYTSGCKAIFAYYNSTFGSAEVVSSSYVKCWNQAHNGSYIIQTVVNPAYHDQERKSIPVDVVGGQIVTDAASKDEARAYTNSVANTITAPNEDDQLVPATEAIGQFDNTSSYPSDTTSTETTTTTNPDGTTSTETKTSDYPAACAWMPSVCEFASNAIDFMKPDFTEPDAVDTPNRELDQKSLDSNLYNYGSSCPADRTLSMNIVGRPFTKTFSFSEICSQLQVLGNLVMAGAYLYGGLIVARGV